MNIVSCSLESIVKKYQEGDNDAGIYLINKYSKVINKYSRENGITGPINEDYQHELIESILRLLKGYNLNR